MEKLKATRLAMARTLLVFAAFIGSCSAKKIIGAVAQTNNAASIFMWHGARVNSGKSS
jgi:hypothetical protein